MSRTDKTRPFHIKQNELRDADPYGFQRDTYGMTWRPEFRCGHTCNCNSYWWPNQKSKDRRARKAAARDWQKEYE